MFKEKQFRIDYCYSSPALRCVQTAMKLLEGAQLQQQIKIRFDLVLHLLSLILDPDDFSIEPGLFECTGWYPKLPRFLTKKEFIENKYLIEKNHQALLDLVPFESEFEYYHRSHAVTKAILHLHEQEDDLQILFVGKIESGH